MGWRRKRLVDLITIDNSNRLADVAPVHLDGPYH